MAGTRRGEIGAGTGWLLSGLMLAWLAGVAWQLQQPALWPVSVYVSAAALSLCGVAASWRWHRSAASKALAPFLATLLAMLSAATLALGVAGMWASLRLADALPAALEGQDLQVTGVVASLPQRSSSGLRFRFEPEQALWRGQPVTLPALLSIGWYKGFDEDAVLTPPQQSLGAGQRWRFTLRLKQPLGKLNPHGFDYELALFEQGVRATGYVRDGPARQLDSAAAHPIERLRQRVRDAIEAHVADRRAAGVLAALSVGDQSAIDREDWELFRNTGIAHLVSISGLHVTMFAWLAGLAIAAAWRRSGRAALWCATPHAARWGGLACAWAYALFSGWGVPSQRTVWMLAVVTVLQTLGVRWPWPLVLLASAVVVTALDPWALLQPGFWLSFMAVGLLMASGEAHGATGSDSTIPQPPGAPVPPIPIGWRATAFAGARALSASLRGGLRTQVIATLGLAPLTLVCFQQVSLVGFVANLVAIPVVTLVITPLALLGALVWPLWLAGAWAVHGLVVVLAWLAQWPGGVWTVPAAPWWAQVAGLLGAALLIMPLPWRVRSLALPLVLPLLLPPRDLPAPGHFELLALDVGQGTAVLVRTHSHLLVYDAGPQYSRDNDAGERVLLPVLRSRGESRIDHLMLSHRDTDHVGGARALLGNLPITALSSSLEATHPLQLEAAARGVASTRCEAGQRWTWDGVRFEVLHPDAEHYDRALRSNAMSCVLKVSGAGVSALLTGDIERDQEASLVARSAEALRSDVLLVPHHGSKTSSTAEFIAAVAPGAAVVQSGYRNRFGHPAAEVLARYRDQGVALVDSPHCGAWRWQTWQLASRQTSCQREVARRYWRHLPASIETP